MNRLDQIEVLWQRGQDALAAVETVDHQLHGVFRLMAVIPTPTCPVDASLISPYTSLVAAESRVKK